MIKDPEQREALYEKCRDCHLFVEVNDAGCQHSGTGVHDWEVVPGATPHHLEHVRCKFCKVPEADVYEHLHRGDDVDEALANSHRAEPSGRVANLLTWKTYGPLAMRERFTS